VGLHSALAILRCLMLFEVVEILYQLGLYQSDNCSLSCASTDFWIYLSPRLKYSGYLNQVLSC